MYKEEIDSFIGILIKISELVTNQRISLQQQNDKIFYKIELQKQSFEEKYC